MNRRHSGDCFIGAKETHLLCTISSETRIMLLLLLGC